MKVLYGLVVSTLISTFAFSQTNVSGTIVSNAEWTLSGSPYTLTSTVGIPSGVTLMIQAGVQVNGNFDLLIKGKILIQGSAAQPVEFNNTRLIFKSADLSESAVSYIHFMNSGGVQLADEAEHSEDNPKNSNTLIVKNSQFSSSAYARTKGYQTTAKLKLEDCTLNNATVYGYYPRSEVIELERAVINSSNLVSDSYNFGIHIRNSSVTQSTFSLGCCDANFDISDTDIQNSSFTHFNSYSLIKLNRVTLTNTYLNTPYAIVTIADCKFTATSIPVTTLIRMASGSITNSTLEGSSALTLVSSVGSYDVIIEKVNFKNFNVALELTNFNSIYLKSNNFINGSSFNIKNLTNKNIDATGNYWGTTDDQVIKNKIWDLYDDINYGIVDYSGFATAPIFINSLPKPTAVFKGVHSNGTLVRWTKVNDPNITGYRIYKNIANAYTFVANAGDVNSFIVNESFATEFLVTSYTALADGSNDQAEGYESSFSDPGVPFIAFAQSNLIAACEGKSVQMDFTTNYTFDPSSSLYLIASLTTNFAVSDTVQTKVANSPDNFLWTLSDTLTAHRTFYYRIASDEMSIFSEARSIEIMATPMVNFTVSEYCMSGAYRIIATGITDDIDVDWSVDGASISEKTTTSFVATWTTEGEKTLTLTATTNGCETIVTKTLNVSLTNSLPVPAICSIEFDEASGNNKLSWQYVHPNLLEIKVYREIDRTDEYVVVATVPASEQTYIDDTSLASQRAYRYRISAVDKCGHETSESEAIKSFHLQLGAGGDGNWNLSWDERHEDGGIEIYRQTTDPAWEKIGSLPSIHSSFTDTDSPQGASFYQARMVGAGSCLIASNIVSNGIMSIGTERVGVTVYPNPAIDKITFYHQTTGQYELINMNGVPILSGAVEAGENNVSLSSLSQGLYMLKISSLKNQSLIRVLKKS